jgi:AraC-like DNA-binding protein
MDSATSFTMSHGWLVILADLGISMPEVVRRAGLSDHLLVESATHMGTRDYFAFWQALDDVAEDPELPLRNGRAVSVESFDPPIFAAICSPDLNVAADRIAQYKRLIGPMRLEVRRTSLETTLEIVWPDGAQPPALLARMELVFWVALARLATRKTVRPLRVASAEPPAEGAAFRRYLGVEVTQGRSSSVTFSASDAQMPFLTADEPMWEFFEPELRRRMAHLEADATATERVRSALLELLPRGDSSMESVARRLMLSPRTLQRRLRAERMTYRTILNETREALARHYLSKSVLPASEIAFLLGYDEPNSFYRAVQAWTGQTPDALRVVAAHRSSP